MIDMCHFWQDPRNNLNATWTIANHRNPFTLLVCQLCGSGPFDESYVLNSHILRPNERYVVICLWIRASLGFGAISSCLTTLFLGWRCCLRLCMYTHSPGLESDNVVSCRPEISNWYTNFKLPFRAFVIPCSGGDFLLQLNIIHASIFLYDMFPIFVDLRSTCVKAGPFFIGLESSLVCMGGDI